MRGCGLNQGSFSELNQLRHLSNENRMTENNHFLPARSFPQPCTGGMMPGLTRSFHTSALMLVKVGLPYSSSIAGMTCSDMAAPPGTEIASASGQVLAASRPTSRAISKPCSKVIAKESDAHWFRLVMPMTL